MKRFCDQRGLLVDGKTRLADDSHEFWHTPTFIMVGCGQLKCEKCGALVRSSVDGPIRKYECDCAAWEATSSVPLDNEHDSPNDPDLPWSCDGHEPPTLPLQLGELTVGADFPSLVAKILEGVSPRPLGLRDEGPSLWLGWLYNYLQGLPEADLLSSAIGERVADPNPAVMGAALFFFSRFPKARGVDKVVDYAESHFEEMAIGRLIPDYYVPTIWDVLIARLEMHEKEPVDARVAALIEKVMVTPLATFSTNDFGDQKLVQSLYKSLRKDIVARALDSTHGTFDSEDLRIWLADHIVDIDAAAPGRWKKVLTRLSDWALKPDTGHLIIIAGTRILQSGAASPDALEEWIEWRRVNHGWMEDAWVLPLKDTIEQQRRQLTAN